MRVIYCNNLRCIDFIFNDFNIALVAVSEEVRSRCHVKHTLPRWPIENNQVNELIASDAENISSQPVS